MMQRKVKMSTYLQMFIGVKFPILLISPQARRHAEEELEALKTYKENHPNDDHDPTPLELYCDANPSALECKIYGD